jgi:hypothetical protein
MREGFMVLPSVLPHYPTRLGNATAINELKAPKKLAQGKRSAALVTMSLRTAAELERGQPVRANRGFATRGRAVRAPSAGLLLSDKRGSAY